jgi:prolyl-tRNA editing enzyme YbaK/EbsC (Cys-tRNA(Pro) deacylase)
MTVEAVKEYFKQFGMQDNVMEFEYSSATVELAAQALNVIPARIAKTISLKTDSGCLLVVSAGDAKIDNIKFKAEFGIKAKMLSAEEVSLLVGHQVGGVCPFAIPENIQVYFDESLKRFETVFPACGSGNSAIELTCEQIFLYGKGKKWVDVCKGWQPSEEPLQQAIS